MSQNWVEWNTKENFSALRDCAKALDNLESRNNWYEWICYAAFWICQRRLFVKWNDDFSKILLIRSRPPLLAP